MLIQPYRPEELHFAYCYRAYLRWRTYQGRCCPPLAKLDQPTLDGIARRYDIHVLESASDETDLLVLVSLLPPETISGCASKLKGQTSKWLSEALQLQQPTDLLSRGYFACTAGKSTREAVEQYLSTQCEHHHYADRPHPPVFVQVYDLSPEDEARLQPAHARTVLQLHLVLATWKRQGVLVSESAQTVAEQWRGLGQELQFALLKVSFVPDHVHVAVQVHPSVSPADVAVALMNAAQKVVFEQYSDAAIRARVDRLWQPSAYIGAYGDLASPQVSKYIENWSVAEVV